MVKLRGSFARFAARRLPNCALNHRRWRRLRLESLENRQLMAVVHWIAGSGDWNNGANWSNGLGPAADDDVVIDVAGEITVTHTTGEHEVASITADDRFSLTGGTLRVNGNISGSGPLEFAGGRLENATIAANTTLINVNPSFKTFKDITIDGTLDMASNGSFARSEAGLVINGTLLMGSQLGDTGSIINRVGNNTIAGTGTLLFGGATGNQLGCEGIGSVTTIGPGLTLRGKSGNIGVSFCPIVNQGMIHADTEGGVLTAHFGDAGFASTGTLQVSAGTLTVDGNWAAGHTAVTGGVLNLKGAVRQTSLGTVTRADNGTAGTIRVLGELTGGLVLNDQLGSLLLQGGRMVGGTLDIAPGSTATLMTIDGNNRFSGVTVNNGLVVGRLSGFLFDGETILNQTLNIEQGGLFVDGMLAGTGTVVFGPTQSNALRCGNSLSMILGPTITVRGHSGNVGGFNCSLVNRGTIQADTPAGLMVVDFANTPTPSSGTLRVSDGILAIRGTQWRSGATEVYGGVLTLQGEMTSASWGNFFRANNGMAGRVNLSGILSGGLTLNDALGSIYLTGGQLQGGTLDVAPGNSAKLIATDFSNQFSGVTINEGLDISTQFGAQLIVKDGSTLNQMLQLGGTQFGGTLAVDGTLLGNGTIVFGELSSSLRCGFSLSMTIGPEITVRGRNGSVGSFNCDLTNEGTIHAEAGGAISVFDLSNYSNGVLLGGTWMASDGAMLRLDGAEITTIRANVTIDGVGSRIVRSAGALRALDSLATIASDGYLSLNHGVNFGTAGNLDNQGVLSIGPESTLSVNGALTLGTTSTLSLGIGGAPASGQFGRLVTTGNGAIDGILDVRLADGYGPNSGLTYPVMTFGSRTGDFATRNLSLGSLPMFTSEYVGNSLEVTTIADAPDLTFVNVQPPAQTFVGNQVTIPYSVRNTSAMPTPTGWHDAIYLSLDNVLDPSDVLLGSPTHAIALPGQASRSGVLTAAIPRIADGDYHVLVVIDADSAIPDLNRSGNIGVSAGTMRVAHESTPLILGQRTTGYFESEFGIDRWMFAASEGQQLRFDFIAAGPNKARFTLTGPNNYTAFADLSADSDFFLLPSNGSYTLEARSASGIGASSYTFQLNETSQTVLPLESTFMGTLAGTGGAKLFEVSLPATDPLRIEFMGATTTDNVEIYTKFGSPPNRQHYDTRSTRTGAHHLLQIPLGIPGKLYILVYSNQVPDPSSFSLRVDRTAVYVDDISPADVTAGVTTQLSITGLGFLPGTTVQLIPTAGGTPLTSSSVDLIGANKLSAFIAIPSGATGNYDVHVSLPNGSHSVLQAGLQVQQGLGRLETQIIASLFPVQGTSTFYVEYANTGTATMPAPLLTLFSDDPDQDEEPWLSLDQTLASRGFWTSAEPTGFRHSVQFLASGQSPGWLQPGEKRLMPIQYIGLRQPHEPSDLELELRLVSHEWGDPTPILWSEVEAALRPAGISSEVWPIVFANLQNEIGPTWGDYHQRLIDNAVYLDGLGQRVTDASVLLGFELQQSLGLDPFGSLASRIDAAIPSPGLRLNFERSYPNSLVEHYAIGPFGRGWTTRWHQSLEVMDDGTVLSHQSDGVVSRFQPDRRYTGVYLSEKGNTDQLRKLSGSLFERTDSDGTVTRFHSDGRIDQLRDVHGNTITAGYNNSRLMSLTHSSGGMLSLAYNAAGRISSITDSFGRITSYSYDSSDTHLISVTDAEGMTTYQYVTGQGAAREHALTEIIEPGEVTTKFDYDEAGRIVAMSSSANAQRTTISYDGAGKVTVTDQDGVIVQWFLDANGLLVRTEDANGYFENVQFDHEYRPVRRTDATGRTETQEYTTAGARFKYINAQFDTTIFDPTGPRNQSRGYVDANNNETTFTFDAVGNITVVTYPDSSQETTSYDGLGNVNLITNRRGQSVDVDFNAAGQVTRTLRADGTTVDYAYNERGRLTSAIDAGGTTTLTYDAADRLTRVTYSNGRWLQFQYDPAGRRTRLEDHTGHVTQYSYDSLGRMQSVRGPGDALVVQYTYTPAGRVAREDKGNGTSTEYSYDAVGRTSRITHRAPNGNVSAEIGYSYDLQGRISTMSTSDGTWTYAYDLTDQLIHAQFASINALIANQDLVYEYDALGNRVRTISNGFVTNYASNSMNQITNANATTYQYDLDGNIIQESRPEGVRQYTYDSQNRLISVQTPQGSWQYEYDVFGNRSAVIANGQRTEYLIDPTGLGNIIAEYSTTVGGPIHYLQGLGLVSRADADSMSFYEFDALGSTTNITGPEGMVANSYAYQPFGEVMRSTGAVPNAFGYVGAWGIMDDGNGLYFMRARHYSPTLGRFQQQDPARLAGGDFNLYRYVENNPSNAIDPTGLAVTSIGCQQVGGIIHGKNGSSDQFTCTYPVPDESDQANCVAHGGTLTVFGKNNDIEVCIEDIVDEPQPPKAPSTPKGKGFGKPIGGTGNAKPYSPLDPPPLTTFNKALKESEERSRLLRSLDPNEKFGATGFGPQAFVNGETPIPYTVHFENLGPGSKPTPTQPAEAPAQRIEITDQLSSHLDWTTFAFTEFGVGDIKVRIESADSYYFTTLDLTQNEATFAVEVEMSFDVSLGQVRVVFQAIDQATLLPPDVQLGVLPPEDGTGRGQGYFNYEVLPKPGLVTGTEIRNIALIKFDANPVIATNQIDPQDPAAGTSPNREALNTIDAAPPTSSVAAIQAVTRTLDFVVSWSGSDDTHGSGIARYDIFVSIDNGPYQPWKTDATNTSAVYSGQNGHQYAFYSVAADHVGHIEAKLPAPEGVTIVEALAGDFDGDQLFGCADIDSLVAAVIAGSASPTFDLTEDHVVNLADITAWLSVAGEVMLPSEAPYLPGDANLNGLVDSTDFNQFASQLFSSTAGWCGGDFNADGWLDGSDFNIWNQHKFMASQQQLARGMSRAPKGPHPAAFVSPVQADLKPSFDELDVDTAMATWTSTGQQPRDTTRLTTIDDDTNKQPIGTLVASRSPHITQSIVRRVENGSIVREGHGDQFEPREAGPATIKGMLRRYRARWATIVAGQR